MQTDQNIRDLAPMMADLVAQGADVFLKVTCPCCGEKVTTPEVSFVAVWGPRAPVPAPGEEAA